ncbi:MAG: hypothetical protein ABI068_12120 [Ktedonobacterales bacterium]
MAAECAEERHQRRTALATAERIAQIPLPAETRDELLTLLANLAAPETLFNILSHSGADTLEQARSRLGLS